MTLAERLNALHLAAYQRQELQDIASLVDRMERTLDETVQRAFAEMMQVRLISEGKSRS